MIKIKKIPRLNNIMIVTAFLSFAVKSHDSYQKYDSSKFLPKGMSGLVSEHYYLAEKLSEAKEVLENIKELSVMELIYYRLALINLKLKNYRQYSYYINKISNTNILINDELMADIYELTNTKEKKLLLNLLIKNGYFDKKQNEYCPYYCLNNRKIRAKNLFNWLSSGELPSLYKNKALSELYIFLPEVFSEQQLNSLGLLSIKNSFTVKDFLKRTSLLIIFGNNNEAKSSIEFIKNKSPQPFSVDMCEVYYQEAKINKNLRQKKLSREQFQKLINSCDEGVKIRARYMDLSMASTSNNVEELPKFEAFVRDYPTSGFSDDILIFKIELLNSLGQKDEVISTYQKIIDEYPDGDMIEKALFDLAFLYAKDHKLALSFKYLNKLKSISKEGSLSWSKANYWLARLLLFNEPYELSSPDKTKIKYVGNILNFTEKNYHPNYYSWLSWELLDNLGIKEKPKNLYHIKDKVLAKTVWHKDLASIHKYLALGFRKEALAFLNEMQIKSEDLPKLFDAALLYNYANRPDLAYQKIIKCHLNNNELIQSELPLNVRYPRVFNEEMEFISSHVDIPKDLLLGLVRQESVFFANAESFRGAIGLAQLLPSSALEIGKSLGVVGFASGHLFEPKLNLLLGASLFIKYWQRFKLLPMTLSAYNAGPSAVSSWLKKRPNVPVDTFVEEIPYKETKNYVINVLGAAFSYQLLNGGLRLTLFPSVGPVIKNQ